MIPEPDSHQNLRHLRPSSPNRRHRRMTTIDHHYYRQVGYSTYQHRWGYLWYSDDNVTRLNVLQNSVCLDEMLPLEDHMEEVVVLDVFESFPCVCVYIRLS
jgi:hypothetical protein